MAEAVTNGTDGNFLTPEEAADYLGLSSAAFNTLTKQYGIGRHHLARTHDQIVYAIGDLDSARAVINATHDGTTSAARP